MFVERIGCYSIESKQMLSHKGSQSETVKDCSYIAWSRGLKVFAVRNISECLGDEHLPSVLPRLKTSKGCHGGGGGVNVSDVYRLTSKRLFASSNNENDHMTRSASRAFTDYHMRGKITEC